MRLKYAIACLVCVAVTLVWYSALKYRLPYLDQIPVYDADVMTSFARMCVHEWWVHGPINMWFATPYSPLSVEMPTLADVTLYQSWPPGAYVPVFLLAKILDVEPSVPLINWFNVATHGLIALAVAFTAFNIARLNKLHVAACGLIAAGVAFPVLYPSGLIFFSPRSIAPPSPFCCTRLRSFCSSRFRISWNRRGIAERFSRCKLVVIYLAFLVDWLSYTLFAFWLLVRWTGAWLGYGQRWSLRQWIGVAMLPVSAFALYLTWRFLTPGSLARTEGVAASLYELGWKIVYRMNLTDDHHITDFPSRFLEMHAGYYSPHVLPLIVGTTLATAIFLALSYHRTADPLERRTIFNTASLLVLVTVPFYAHMLLLYQHTAIHRWAVAKAMFAYALVPFALLPISIVVFLRLYQYPGIEKFGFRTRSAVAGILLAIGAFCGAAVSAWGHYGPHILAQINPGYYHMWDDISHNTGFRDVVFSPVLHAAPIGVEVGVANKLVYPATNFAEVDRKVDRVCGAFNVVIALPPGADIGAFASRTASDFVETGNIRLLRFANYAGAATGCP